MYMPSGHLQKLSEMQGSFWPEEGIPSVWIWEYRTRICCSLRSNPRANRKRVYLLSKNFPASHRCFLKDCEGAGTAGSAGERTTSLYERTALQWVRRAHVRCSVTAKCYLFHNATELIKIEWQCDWIGYAAKYQPMPAFLHSGHLEKEIEKEI